MDVDGSNKIVIDCAEDYVQTIKVAIDPACLLNSYRNLPIEIMESQSCLEFNHSYR